MCCITKLWYHNKSKLFFILRGLNTGGNEYFPMLLFQLMFPDFCFYAILSLASYLAEKPKCFFTDRTLVFGDN